MAAVKRREPKMRQETVQRREDILKAALTTFGSKGYKNGSLAEIAEQVDMTHAGVLHHFGSKDQLLLEVLSYRDKTDVAGLLRGLEPDVALCWGFGWKIPQEALDVPRHGIVNQHPAPLPRFRGPIPMAWAMREGDGEFFITWHRMDAELDTGPILAQTTVPILDEDTTIFEIGPKMLEASIGLLPRVFERLDAGDPGDPQATEGASWAGYFEEDYATIDWSKPRREIHNQVRAWHLSFDGGPVVGPIAELDGKRVKVNRTSLSDPGDGSQAVDAGDGKIWILESEPAA